MEALASGLAQTFCMVCYANSKTKDGGVEVCTYSFLRTLIETNDYLFNTGPQKAMDEDIVFA